jgi:hypothetical protein
MPLPSLPVFNPVLGDPLSAGFPGKLFLRGIKRSNLQRRVDRQLQLF